MNADKPLFDAFYKDGFEKVRFCCGYHKNVKEVVEKIKAMGLRIALATNPIFPAIATESRIRWAVLEPKEFEFYTTYENIGYCKPNLKYYQEILDRMDLEPEECLMVGNDVTEDMVAERLGMKVFLLTDCLINKEEADISVYPRGNLIDMIAYIKGALK